MRVDFSDWYSSPGLVARKFTYSKMGNARDTELEVHFDIQAGLSIHTFVCFIINDLDLTQETSLRGSLRPMDGSGPEVSLTLIGRPDGEGGAVMSVFSREDQGRCLKAFLDGKDMHFGVDAGDGEKLIRLPLPNDGVFQTVYREARDRVQAAPASASPVANVPTPTASPYRWQGPTPQSLPPETDFDGFEIGEAFYFGSLNTMGRIVGIEEFEGSEGTIDRFVIELEDSGVEMKVPISKLREIISVKPRSHHDGELEEDSDDEDDERESITPNHNALNSESMEFKIDEFVVYPAHGVGRILGIENQEIAGVTSELFVINFMKDKMILRVPTAKASNVGMRKLSEPALIEWALEALNGYAQSDSSSWSNKARIFEAKINSGDIVAIAEVVRDLYSRDSESGQSYSERQLYEAALDRLSREIAVVRHMTETEVVEEIEEKLAARSVVLNDPKTTSGSNPKIDKVQAKVNFTPWKILTGRYSEIGREYEFTGLPAPNTFRKLDVRCRLTFANDRVSGRTAVPYIYIVVEPQMMKQTGYLAAVFAPSGAEIEYEIVTLQVDHNPTGGNVLSVTPDKADQCLRVLMLGRQIMVRLISPEGEFAAFPLENDGSFADAYHELKRRILDHKV